MMNEERYPIIEVTPELLDDLELLDIKPGSVIRLHRGCLPVIADLRGQYDPQIMPALPSRCGRPGHADDCECADL